MKRIDDSIMVEKDGKMFLAPGSDAAMYSAGNYGVYRIEYIPINAIEDEQQKEQETR